MKPSERIAELAPGAREMVLVLAIVAEKHADVSAEQAVALLEADPAFEDLRERAELPAAIVAVAMFLDEEQVRREAWEKSVEERLDPSRVAKAVQAKLAELTTKTVKVDDSPTQPGPYSG